MKMENRERDLLEFLKKKVDIGKQKRKRLFFTVDTKKIREIGKGLFKRGLRLSTISAIEGFDKFEILYHFSDDSTGKYYNPSVFVPLKNPKVPSIADLIKGAEWIEREIHDLFGIEFINHPELKPLLKEGNEKIPETPLRVKRREK